MGCRAFVDIESGKWWFGDAGKWKWIQVLQTNARLSPGFSVMRVRAMVSHSRGNQQGSFRVGVGVSASVSLDSWVVRGSDWVDG